MSDNIVRCRSGVGLVRTSHGLDTQAIGDSDPCHASPRVTTPCTHRGREGLLDVFQVVVVEYNVELWVLRDGDGLFL